MSNNLIDTHQLVSLIELTNAMAEDSIAPSLDANQIISQSVDKLMWIIDFDLCLILDKSTKSHLNLVLNNENTKHDFESLTKLPIVEYTQNMPISLSDNDYYLFYDVLYKDNENAKLILFLQRSERFPSQISIVLELFCTSLKKLLETKKNELKNRKLQNEKAILEESNKLKSLFLATISHEIRTPMNGILGIVQLLKDTPLNNQQVEMLDTITNRSDDLITILNDILDYSQLETGKVALNEVDFNVIESVEDVVKRFSAAAHLKGLSITTAFDNSTPVIFKGDVERIKQILSNLVHNAVKFTQVGEINIIVNFEETATSFYQVNIIVKDTGIGISKIAQKNLFQPFTQADNSMSRTFGGTGLGLAISANLTKAMNGTISVESEELKGTAFLLSIPLKTTQNPKASRVQVDSENELTNTINPNHKILVVEDGRINQTIVKMMLSKLGFECDVAVNGLEALKALNNSEYSIIFMDLQMPEMDGLTATKDIVKRYGQARPIIVAMTANISKEDRKNCVAVGMDDFILKPLLITELERTLSTRYKRKQ
ncbi:putative two-component sensor [Moritella sp. PE36]|uniref:ATP-binding protein n=1 Tax=Moritella sp. PE36 TaxID=58051 RepID=UPI0001569A14|nr:ATP-binding protein [Moritella sp. PE36]EDM65767.1 putative two-component sensor [Moritella sp. PE36]